MKRQGYGIAFIVISAFLISMKYLCAAIYGSGDMSWSNGLFDHLLDYVGPTLSTFSLLALLVGIGYFISGELNDYLSKKQDS